MEKIRRTLWGLSFSLLLFIGCHKNTNLSQGKTHLLPAPQKMKLSKDVSLRPDDIKTIYLHAKAGKKDRFAAHLLQDKMDSLFGRQIKVKKVDSYDNLSRPAIVLGIPSGDQDFSEFSSKLGLPVPKSNTGESYVLNIASNLITISAGGETGLFYGVQTLNQLLEDAKWKHSTLQGKLVQDWPDLKERWVHFDEKHHLDRDGYLKKAIAKLAQYKVNGVVFEFENKFAYQSHPEIAAPNSFTPEQVKNLTEYAHKYHIDIIPLVQGLGHAGYILKHPKYKGLREDPASNWAFNPLKKGTYNLLFDLYHETMEATRGVNYFHVGGDEVRFTGHNSQMQGYKKEHGPFSLNLRWLNKVNDYVNGQGRTMVYWDDMPLRAVGIWNLTHNDNLWDQSHQKFNSRWRRGTTKLDSVIDKFPQNAIYMQWTYSQATEGDARILDWFKKHDIKEISATAVQNMRPLIPSYKKKPSNIKSLVALSAKKHVLGELCTAWDNSGLHFETFWIGFLASAEYGWSHRSPDSIRRYWNKYIYRFFGPNTTGLYQAFHNLSKRVEFWNTAIMKEGTKSRGFRKGYRFIELPSLQNPPPEGSWAEHFKPLMKKAKAEKEKNARAVKTLQQNMDRVTRNSYNLKVFASMGRFMKTDANLVLSIGKIARYADKARAADQKNHPENVAVNLNKMAATADSAWNNYKSSYKRLQNLWQVSRYPKGGKGFIPNRYQHFASRREDLSYLIMAEEGLDLPGYANKLRKETDQ